MSGSKILSSKELQVATMYILFQFMTEGFVLNTINFCKSPLTHCPVEFVYIKPKANTDNKKWIAGLVVAKRIY